MSESTRKQLGRRIKHLREERGLSQRKFSLMIGMDRSYLISVEGGKRNIAVDNLEKIACGLDVSLTELFDGVGNR